jgi:hypothetical protein
MGKWRNLKGLPNSLVESYFSSMMYFDNGYMACWIWKKANELDISELEIDILNRTTKPAVLEATPITAYLSDLQLIINRTLASNNFESGFIKKAKLKVWIAKDDAVRNQVSCQGIVEDIKGRDYAGKVYQEQAYPISDSN